MNRQTDRQTLRKCKVMSTRGLQNGTITGSATGLEGETLVTVLIGAKEYAVSPEAVITKQ